MLALNVAVEFWTCTKSECVAPVYREGLSQQRTYKAVQSSALYSRLAPAVCVLGRR